MKLAMRLGAKPQLADNDRDPREGESAEIIDLASRMAYPVVTQRKGRSDALGLTAGVAIVALLGMATLWGMNSARYDNDRPAKPAVPQQRPAEVPVQAPARLTAEPALAAPAAAPGVHADGSGGQHVTVTIPQHSTPPTQQSLACTGAGGTTLGDNPTLHPGDQLSCTGSGFGAGERVGVTLSPPARDLGTVTAGSDGAARDTVSLPAELGAGPHTLTFTGQTDHGTASFAFTVTIVATVPVSGGGSAGSGGGGWLPRTGTNLLSLASTGAGLVIVGLLGMVAARRRRRDAVLGVLPEGERG